MTEKILGHRRAEAQVVQEKISKLQTDFERKSERLLAERKELLDKNESHSRELFEHLTKKIEKGSQELLALTKQVDDTETIVSGKIVEIEQLEKETITLNEQISVKKIDLEQTKLAISRSNTDKLAAEKRITGLSTEEEHLKDSITTLQETFKYWQGQIDAKKAEYATESEEKEQSIKLLDAKLLKVTQELTERERVEESTRDQLATMQRTLDERDRNLRIREAKVEQGEHKLIQNANLLNL